MSKITSSNPAVVSTLVPDGDTLKAEVAKLTERYVGKINVEKQKIDAAEGRVDSFFLRIGMFVNRFIEEAKARGETRGDDHLLKSIAKDEDCKVKKGALYNARSYYAAHSAMTDKFGKAPDVPMTFFVKVRNKNLTIEEQDNLLVQAEADKEMTASKLNALVAAKLKDKGFGRNDPAPDAELVIHCNKAFSALTKVAGLLKKGIAPSSETVSLMSKTAKMVAACLAKTGQLAGQSDGQPDAQAPWDSGDAAPEERAS